MTDIRITVRNLPHTYSKDNLADDIKAATGKLPKAYHQHEGSIIVHWFQPGEAPSKFLQQQQASGSKRVLGPVPGWVILNCLDRKVSECTAAYFDGRALLAADHPTQLASVEFPTLQKLPPNARRPMSSEDLSAARAEAGSIFDDPDFRSFKKNIEDEAEAPIPCSQEQAFDFLNKWLAAPQADAAGPEASHDAAAAAVDETAAEVVGRKRKLTFLEKVRLRYDAAQTSSSSLRVRVDREREHGRGGGGSSRRRGEAEKSTTSGAARRRRQKERESGPTTRKEGVDDSKKSGRRLKKEGGAPPSTGGDGERKKRKRGGKRERERRERQEARDAQDRQSARRADDGKRSGRTAKKPVADDKSAFPTLATTSPAAPAVAAAPPVAVPKSRSSAAAADSSPKKSNFTVTTTKSKHADPASPPAPKSGGKKVMMMRRPVAAAPEQS